MDCVGESALSRSDDLCHPIDSAFPGTVLSATLSTAFPARCIQYRGCKRRDQLHHSYRRKRPLGGGRLRQLGHSAAGCDRTGRDLDVLARNSKRKEYTVAYYWLRLLTRYWVALNILHYAYIKIYPSQMPYPSISNLHTLVGETAPYRYYWAIIGLSTWYQILLGCIEGIAGSLLFFRRTTAIGALLNLGMLYNVAYANFAYDGGVHLLSAEISLLAGFLLIPYIPNLIGCWLKRKM